MELKLDTSKTYAIALEGGGAKGAYEIGVWKYLREIGLDSQISVISGTSVGGLNAFLIGYGDYDLAERLWLKEVEDKILDLESQSHSNDAVFSRDIGFRNRGCYELIHVHIFLLAACGNKYREHRQKKHEKDQSIVFSIRFFHHEVLLHDTLYS